MGRKPLKISRFLDRVSGAGFSVEQPRIILSQDRRAVIDGLERILDYEEDRVLILAGKREICLTGSGLELRQLKAGQLILTGRLERVEYLPAGR